MEAFERGQREVLELIASGAPLPNLLGRIIALVEGQAEGMICSILLFDQRHGVLRHGAARGLSQEFVDAIDGLPIGAKAGSCGTAVYRRERVVVEDIARHEYWEAYRHLALPHGLRACWSSPIFGSTQAVLGTFAMYYREPRGPRDIERHWVDRATHLAAIAIERHRAEEAVRFSEERAEAAERLRALTYNAVSDALYYVGFDSGGDFRFLSVNPAFLSTTGLTEEQVLGRRVRDVLPPPSAEVALDHFERATRSGRRVTWVEVTPYPAGVKHGEVSVTPIFDEHDRCSGLIGAVHDITEHVRAQAQIREQAELLDQAKDAILLRDPDGTIRFWNKGAERLYGWTSAEAVGRNVKELIYREPLKFQHAQQAAIANGVWRGELEHMARSGQVLTVDASWSALRDEAGGVRAVLAINSDITEKKRLEQQVMRTQRLESLGTLAGGIAHDFNNILSAVVANVAITLEELEPAHPARESLLEIEKASARATDLVKQILTFSRQQKPKRQFVRLVDVVVEAMKLLKATTPAAVRIQTRFDARTPQVFADPSQLHQVIVNLATNAAHAMHDDRGVLTVAVERTMLDAPLVEGLMEIPTGVYATLVVSDTGTGMDAATLERIYDPFFTTKEPGKGTGLGLAVVHGIVRAHDGAIAVHSIPGRGSTFRVYLPAAKVHELEKPPESAAEVLSGRGGRVLLVDDEEAIVKATARLLGRLGHEVTGAVDPMQALESFQSDPARYDAMVVDFSMPGLSGLEFARSVLRVRPDLPIIVTSGSLPPEEVARLDEAGIAAVIHKPSTPQELSAALQRILDRARH